MLLGQSVWAWGWVRMALCSSDQFRQLLRATSHTCCAALAWLLDATDAHILVRKLVSGTLLVVDCFMCTCSSGELQHLVEGLQLRACVTVLEGLPQLLILGDGHKQTGQVSLDALEVHVVLCCPAWITCHCHWPQVCRVAGCIV